MKRHDRPYACIRSECFKVFGSKHDWTRHELSQHDPPILYCSRGTQQTFLDPASPSQQNCDVACASPEAFAVHLSDRHNVAISSREIRMTYFGSFWCGFCRSKIRFFDSIVNSKSTERIGEDNYIKGRFQHIDEHFIKEGKKKQDWEQPKNC